MVILEALESYSMHARKSDPECDSVLTFYMQGFKSRKADYSQRSIYFNEITVWGLLLPLRGNPRTSGISYRERAIGNSWWLLGHMQKDDSIPLGGYHDTRYVSRRHCEGLGSVSEKGSWKKWSWLHSFTNQLRIIFYVNTQTTTPMISNGRTR